MSPNLEGCFCIARFHAACILAAFLVLFSIGSASGDEARRYATGEILVQFVRDATGLQKEELEQRYQLTLIAEYPQLNARHYSFSIKADAAAVARDLSTEPIVKLAEPNFLKRLNTIPQDEFVGLQWSINDDGQLVNGKNGPGGFDINLDGALGIYQRDQSVIVAVLDSGVALDHPDILPRI